MPEDQRDSIAGVARVHLLTGEFDAQIDRIEVHRITLQPAQQTGRHTHPGGVVGYVVDGDILFEIDGQPAMRLQTGSVFYEPPGAVITRFDNAWTTATTTFIVCYPLTGEQALISTLDQDLHD
jgi:quercetin dioxygenase-like cupin family protein